MTRAQLQFAQFAPWRWRNELLLLVLALLREAACEPAAAPEAPTLNFCGTARTRSMCKQESLHPAEEPNARYAEECKWDSSCGCIKKSCICGQYDCLHQCVEPSYPQLHCDVDGACKCLAPPSTAGADGGATGGGGAEEGRTVGGDTGEEPGAEAGGGTGETEAGGGTGETEAVGGGTEAVPATTPPATDSIVNMSTVAATDVPQTTNASGVLTTTPAPTTTTPLPLGRTTMDPAEAKALASQVTTVVATAIGGVLAAGAAGAAAGPAAMAMIGQVQVLSQLGKVGGGGGALSAFSEGFEWANLELPVSLFPGGNMPEPDPAGEEPTSTGVRRWLDEARRSLRRAKRPRPRPGESACENVTETLFEEDENVTETLFEGDENDCDRCGFINGIPLLDKLVVVCVSLIAVVAVRSLAQLIVTKCCKRDPMDALRFPVWEGPTLLVHWFSLFLFLCFFLLGCDAREAQKVVF